MFCIDSRIRFYGRAPVPRWQILLLSRLIQFKLAGM